MSRALPLALLAPRQVVARVTVLGPDDPHGVRVNARKLGALPVGAERTVTFRFAKPVKRFSIVEVHDGATPTGVDVRF